ncbi:MAG: type II toxin-antitoxin system YafQ family toxin [Rhodocyclales bacterium]|nr:type II toxin-antitoxin system YafQ family toxin [Rhodocyclales bacterium]
MTSKKTPASKRTRPPRAADYTPAFHKDWERMSRSGRYDLRRLKEVMLLLIANNAPLGAEWKDHAFAGEWADHCEYHVGGDFLLIYQCNEESVIFVRTGTHADLFET